MASSVSAMRVLPSFKQNGFTLPELVVTLVVLGILAAVAIPRFASRSAFDVFGFTEQTRETLRFAQKSAIAKRRTVCISLSSGSLVLTASASFGGTCSLGLIDPSTGKAFAQTIPSQVAVSSAIFTYDASGTPSAGQTITVSSGTSSQTITVDAGTGYVY
jgi:MSHA pilin protein MshC